MLKPEKTRGLFARSDELEADYAELLDLIPDVQLTLDNTTAPTSLKQDKVNQLSTLCKDLYFLSLAHPTTSE